MDSLNKLEMQAHLRKCDQVLPLYRERLIQMRLDQNNEESSEEKQWPDYALINNDDREFLVLMNEPTFHGYFYDPRDKWAYYNAWEY